MGGRNKMDWQEKEALDDLDDAGRHCGEGRLDCLGVEGKQEAEEDWKGSGEWGGKLIRKRCS